MYRIHHAHFRPTYLSCHFGRPSVKDGWCHLTQIDSSLAKTSVHSTRWTKACHSGKLGSTISIVRIAEIFPLKVHTHCCTSIMQPLHQTFTFHPSTRTKQIWFFIALNYSKHFLPFCIWPVLLKTEYVRNRLAGKWQSNYFWYSLCRFADAALKQRRQSRILRR